MAEGGLDNQQKEKEKAGNKRIVNVCLLFIAGIILFLIVFPLGISKKQPEYFRPLPITLPASPESRRIEIFQELIKANDRAAIEAIRAYPPLDIDRFSVEACAEQLKKQSQLSFELTTKYEDEVAIKYGLTKEQRGEIAEEGFKKKWPIPDSPELKRLMERFSN